MPLLCFRLAPAAAALLLTTGMVAAEFTKIPRTLASPCDSASESVLKDWYQGPCIAAANEGRLKYTPSGKKLGTDVNLLLCVKAQLDWFCDNTWSAPHLYLEPAEGKTRSGLLVVFLPGTTGTPQGYSRVLQAASRAGNSVLGLSYTSMPVSSSMTDRWCVPNPPGYVSTPDECNQEVHQQMLFGTVEERFQGKSGDLWPVDEQDSVEGILQSVLSEQTWGDGFLRDSKVDWSKVIISGHSQGASHGAYLSQVKQVKAVLLSGPQDAPASVEKWARLPVDASIVRRSLMSLHEECAPEPQAPATYCPAGSMPETLKLMGFGNLTVWNGEGLPQRLENVATTVTPACEATGRFYHGSTATDGCAPDVNDALWEAMFSNMGGAAESGAPSKGPPDQLLVGILSLASFLRLWLP